MNIYALKAVIAARRVADVAFVTDAIAEPVPGKRLRYEGGAEVSAAGDCVRKVGAAGGTLCGSCTNLHQTLVTLVNTLRVPLPDAVRMVASNPARIARLDDKVGTLEVGKAADLVLMDTDTLRIRGTIVAGHFCYTKDLKC